MQRAPEADTLEWVEEVTAHNQGSRNIRSTVPESQNQQDPISLVDRSYELSDDL